MNKEIIPTETTDYPLSPMQEAIYSETVSHERKNRFTILSVMHIKRRLQDDLFVLAFRLLAVRYPILLTSVRSENGQLRQTVLPERVLPCSVDASVEEALQKERNFVFDLEKDVLFRARLVHCEDGDRFIENVHHIIMDGISFNMMHQTLIRYYEMLDSGIPYSVVSETARKEESSSLRFSEYIDFLRKADTQKAKSYWKNLLSEYDGGTVLPYGRPLPDLGRTKKTFSVHRSLYSELRNFALSHDVTVAMVCKVVWAIVLQKYTYSTDILFDEAVSGRLRGIKGIQNAVGLFINTLPVRLRCEPNATLLDLLTEVRAQQIRGLSHATLSYKEILACGSVPPVGTLFNFMPLDAEYFHSQNYRLEQDVSTSSYDLEWYVNCDKIMSFDLYYNTAKYDEDDIDRLGQRLLAAFRSLLDRPCATVGEFSPLTDEDKKELDLFQGASFAYDKNETVVHRFVKQAQRTPQRVAVDFYDRYITYRELDSRSDYVAERLYARGARRGDTVAVYCRRSPEMIVALFGILKCGCAYLPLDESYPQERLSFVLSDSRAVAVLVGKGLSCPASLLQITDWDGNGAPNPTLFPTGDDRAYIIYTSGTSGLPKGVSVRHRGLSNLLYSYEKIYRLQPSDNVLQVASYTFDQSVWDIFGPLCVGARLVLIGEDDVRDPDRIARYSNRKLVTVASFTPAMIAELRPKRFLTLRILDSSGEKAHPSVLKRWLPETTVINTYGPTEYTVNACSYEYNGSESDNVPIGTPIYNTKFFVLGKGDALLGTGMAGELCISGDGIAEGYLNRPELTEQKFVPSADGIGKMYRTGDLVLRRRDGVVQFFDRLDGQIKIHGFRIETEEIDAVLRTLPSVSDCFIRVTDVLGEKAIIAYYVGSATEESVKIGLRTKLPEYMIPKYFVSLSALPRTLAGKIDRTRLPLPKRLVASPSEQPSPSRPPTPPSSFSSFPVFTDEWKRRFRD